MRWFYDATPPSAIATVAVCPTPLREGTPNAPAIDQIPRGERIGQASDRCGAPRRPRVSEGAGPRV